MTTFTGSALRFLTAGLLLAACGTDEQKTLNVSVPFRAQVGSQPFACGQTYTGLGTTGTAFQPKDLRLYVHNVRLVTTAGAEVPVSVTEDGVWQGDGVVLLDFEDASGLCSNGTTGTNTRIEGTVPGGQYSGLRFTLGVPFDLNHRAMESNKPPLKIPTLYWAWQGGYKFLTLDGNTTGQPNGYNLHLGSTACQMTANNVVTGCDNPNRLDVEIAGFNPEQPSSVVLDVAALFASANLDTNQANTAAGCMSAPSDADCAPIFQKLGLAFGGEPGNPGAQVLFRKE